MAQGPPGSGSSSGGGKGSGDDKKTKEAMDDIGGTIKELEKQVEKISKLQSQGSKGGDASKLGKSLETEIKALSKLVTELEKSSKSLKG